jgi:hypothetical protein
MSLQIKIRNRNRRKILIRYLGRLQAHLTWDVTAAVNNPRVDRPLRGRC